MEETKEEDDEIEEGNILVEGDEEDQVALTDPTFKIWKSGL